MMRNADDSEQIDFSPILFLPGIIRHKKASGTTIASYSYVLDNAGRMTSRTEGGAAQAITYDDRNHVTGDAGTAFSYDATGNRTTEGTTTGTIGNRLLSDGRGRTRTTTRGS